MSTEAMPTKTIIKQTWLSKLDQSGTPQALALTAIEKGEILSHYVQKSTIFNYTNATTMLTSNKFSATFIKAQGVKLSEKDTLGTGDIEKFNVGDAITFEWKVPLKVSQGLFGSAINEQLLTLAADKLDRAADKYVKLFEEDAYKELAKTTTSATITTNEAAASIKTKLITEATKLTKMRDQVEGIDLIDKDDIIITITPELADKLAELGNNGNGVVKYFEGGQFAIDLLGGYKIQVSPHLPQNVDAIIAPNWVAAGAIQIVAANIFKLNGTEDLAIYYEAKSLFGTIYTKAITKITH